MREKSLACAISVGAALIAAALLKSSENIADAKETVGKDDIADGEGTPTVKYSFVNLTNIIDDFIPKVAGATAGNIPSLQSDGTLVDSTIASDTVITKINGGNFKFEVSDTEPTDTSVAWINTSGYST